MSVFRKSLAWCTLFALVAGLGLGSLLLGCGSQPGAEEYREGLQEMQRGNYARARVLLEKSISKRPAADENAMAYNYLGVVSTRLGQLDRALDEFEESLRLDSRLFAPRYNLAVLLYEGDKADRARALLEEAASLDAGDVRALRYLARTYLDAGEWEVARDVLREALERVPGSPAILTDMALAERHTGGGESAVALLMRALEEDPDYAPALYDLGLLYEEEMGDDTKAAGFFGHYLDVAPAGIHRDYAMQALERLAARGAVYKGQKELAASVNVTPEAAPPAPTPRVRTVDELLADARRAAEAKRMDDVLRLTLTAAERAGQQRDRKGQERALRTAVSLCSNRAEAHMAWGTYCLEKGRYEPALQAFKRAAALDAGSVEARLGLAEAAVETGEFDAALVALKEAVRLDDRQPDALWALATLYDEHLGVAAAATRAYRRFARLFPDDPRIVRAEERLRDLERPAPEPPPARPEEKSPPPASPAPAPPPRKPEPAPERKPPPAEIKKPRARNTKAAVQAYNRGTVYQERRDWDRAIYYYTRAIENDSSFVNAYYNLGAVYKANGDLRRSKDAYLHAVQLQPKMISARYNLALVYADLDATSAAVQQLRTVLRQNPGHAPSHYALGLLYARNPQARNLARRHYQRFLELAPNDPAAPTVRAWLRTH